MLFIILSQNNSFIGFIRYRQQILRRPNIHPTQLPPPKRLQLNLPLLRIKYDSFLFHPGDSLPHSHTTPLRHPRLLPPLQCEWRDEGDAVGGGDYGGGLFGVGS